MSELDVNEMMEFQAQLWASEMVLTVVLAVLTATDKKALGRAHDSLLARVSEAMKIANAASGDKVPAEAKARFEAVVVAKLDQIFANARNIK
jgi:hypothetical protein